MFSPWRGRKPQDGPPPAARGKPRRGRKGGGEAVIGSGARFHGAFAGDVDIAIRGDVTGEVLGRRISVGPGAAVDASLKAHAVEIAGSVRGRVEAVEVSLAPTAIVDATIVHTRLRIEKGAALRGTRPWHPEAEMTRRCEAWTREFR